MAIPRIRIDQVSKSFGAVQVIRDLSLDIERGEFVSLLGPSGSGKTTLLMLLAGFEQPTAGSIYAVDSWVVLKGAENKAAAFDFIAFASKARRR